MLVAEPDLRQQFPGARAIVFRSRDIGIVPVPVSRTHQPVLRDSESENHRTDNSCAVQRVGNGPAEFRLFEERQFFGIDMRFPAGATIQVEPEIIDREAGPEIADRVVLLVAPEGGVSFQDSATDSSPCPAPPAETGALRNSDPG